MVFRFSAALLLAGSAALAAGCSSTLETFQCETNADCRSDGETGGLCEPSRVCSFADPSCGDDGQRYGKLSGERSNECVGGDPNTADAAGGMGDNDAAVGESVDAAVMPADAMPSDLTPDAMDPTCVNLNMAVYDNYQGDDRVKVVVNGNEEFTCSPNAVAMGADSMAVCQYCMPLGATIRLKAESGIDFEVLVTDCANNCYNDKECEFTATVACNTIHYFDVDFTPLPPPP